ncbi:MAG: hypothetical protein WCL70_07995 [Paludibacter sp.]
MDIQVSNEIKGLPIYIQCKFSNAYTEPEINKGLCIRSFDRALLAQMNDKSGGIIGTLTGNYCIDANDKVWIEANLKYTNRRPTGWFRESDIWHSKKNVTSNPNDNTSKPETKNAANWFAWITGGITVLRLITG